MPHPSSSAWQRFWFRPVSAAGFGLMRVGFGIVGLLTMLLEWNDVDRYYGPDGIVTNEMVSHVMRAEWRFSILDYATPDQVHALYLVLLVALLCVALGVLTRGALIAAVFLLFSFHEYGSITLDGGDTLLRLIGFLLLISPCHRAFTVTNLRHRLKLMRETGKDQPVSERTMSVWPYRLLLWQMIALYVSSAVEKFTGPTWREGSAIAIVLHHTSFSHLSVAVADKLTFLSPVLGYFTLISQFAWALIPVFGILSWIGIHPVSPGRLKRALLVCGALVHGSIFLLMDVGTFSLTVLVAYLGLLIDDDFRAIRDMLNRNAKEPIIVLFDGRCGFCTKISVMVTMLDWLHRVDLVNYHDPKARLHHAPTVSLDALNAAMHVKMPDGSFRVGFYGFRALSRHLPLLWPLWLLLYIPGVPFIGTKVYDVVAKHRR